MTMDLGRVGFESEPRRIVWSAADCSLYALSLGAGFDELAFVAENAIDHPQRVFPTFVLAGVMARESATWSHPGFHTGNYEVHQIVLGHITSSSSAGSSRPATCSCGRRSTASTTQASPPSSSSRCGRTTGKRGGPSFAP